MPPGNGCNGPRALRPASAAHVTVCWLSSDCGNRCGFRSTIDGMVLHSMPDHFYGQMREVLYPTTAAIHTGMAGAK